MTGRRPLTVADLLLADVLRAHGDRSASEAYVRRLTARPACIRGQADQIARFEAADKNRPKAIGETAGGCATAPMERRPSGDVPVGLPG